MDNPELQYTPLQKSTKALQRPHIQKPKHALYSFKMTETLKVRKSIEKPSHFQLPHTHRNTSSFNFDQSISQLDGSSKNLKKHKKAMSFFEKTLQSIYPSTEEVGFAQSSPKWTQQKQTFNSTLRKFSELMSNSTRQNHSPKKETIPGAQQAFDSSRLMSITMRNFKTLEPSLSAREKNEKVRPGVNQSVNLPQIYRVKIQTKRQKDTFYKMHPYFLKKENPKSLQRRADKRRNLIALQQLSIRLRSKQTQKIYGRK